MIMIVMWHLILHGGLLNATAGTKLVLEFFVLFGAVHVNSFVVVTGYFQCEKDFSLKKLGHLITSVWFYKVLFVCIALIMGTFALTKLEIFHELMPIDMRDYWFINCYLALYIISPYLNILISKMTQTQYRKLIIIGFFLFSIIPLITNHKTIANDGYTIINFCYLYLIGGYLKRYPITENIHFKNYSKNKRQCLFLFLTILLCVFNFICYQFSKNLITMENSLIQKIGNDFIKNYRSFSNPFIILQTICYFLYFQTLTIKSKKINAIAKHTLDVYLIHENYYVIMRLYWYLKTGLWHQWSGYIVILLVIFVPIIIFGICILISMLKTKLFQFISNRKIIKRTKRKVYQYIEDF